MMGDEGCVPRRWIEKKLSNGWEGLKLMKGPLCVNLCGLCG